MLTRDAPAKLNLSLVVGPVRADGKHEVASVVEKLTLADTVSVERADTLRVEGFACDTLVEGALIAIARAAGASHSFAARIAKRVPVAAGLGGGSSDAAAALQLANRLLDTPLAEDALQSIASQLGADVPLFLVDGPVFASGDGTTVTPLDLPRDYRVVLWLREGDVKVSTAKVYRDFDARQGDVGYEQRTQDLTECLARARVAADLAGLPGNDLVAASHSRELEALGAFRAGATGAGPVVYGLFADAAAATHAAAILRSRGNVWLTAPLAGG